MVRGPATRLLEDEFVVDRTAHVITTHTGVPRSQLVTATLRTLRSTTTLFRFSPGLYTLIIRRVHPL